MHLREILDADWSRLLEVSRRPSRARRCLDSFSPRFASVVLIRVASSLHAAGWRRLARLPSLVNFVLFGIEVPASVTIGPGLVLPHTQGTVIGAAQVGRNVTVFHQVTLGAKAADFSFDRSQRPRIGDGVILSVGAKVLGPVHVGDGAVIGANAVVLHDVPAGATAVGIPARVMGCADGRQDGDA